MKRETRESIIRTALDNCGATQWLELVQENRLIKQICDAEEEQEKRDAQQTSRGRKLTRKQRRGLDTTIQRHMFPTCRPYYCLLNGNIRTIRELVQKTDDELLKIKNLGRKSLNDIKDLLKKEFDLTLGMTID